jgi:NAD(P)H-dependent FMN reductase
MNIVILNGSHRLHGNCYRFARYASDILARKHDVTIVDLIEKTFCPVVGACLVRTAQNAT